LQKQQDFPFIPFHLSSTQEFSEAKYELNDGQPDLRLHPIHEFSNGMALP
jgi:GntR family transcriptional regulator/MocR family aminotransferase